MRVCSNVLKCVQQIDFSGRIMTYKVLIVDDFLPDRNKMLESLQKTTKFPLEIIGNCANGIEAMNVMEEIVPDIIISDIEMPVCNGLDLAKKVRAKYPHIKMIFCSLYSEFKYIKVAMFYASYGYILKPISIDELENSIGSAIHDIKKNTLTAQHEHEYEKILQSIEKNKTFYAETLVRNIIKGVADVTSKELIEEALIYDIPLIQGGYALCYVEVDGHSEFIQNYRGTKRQVFIFKALEKIRSIIKNENAIPVHIYNGIFVVLVSAQKDSIENERDGIAKKIVDAFKENTLTVSVAVSNCTDDLMDLPNLYIRCQYQIKFKFIFGASTTIHPQDIPEEEKTIDLNMNTIVNEFRFYINLGQQYKMCHYVDNLFVKHENIREYWKARDLSILVSMAIIYLINENNMSLNEVLDNQSNNFSEELFNFESIETTKAWVKETLGKIIKIVHSRSVNANSHLLQKINKYVKTNIKHNFSMEEMAQSLLYSPNYLNRIFKQEMGMSVLEHATQERMNIARDLVLDSKYRFYEIASELGYSNPAYFNMLFKKTFGMTLKEYRMKYSNIGDSHDKKD